MTATVLDASALLAMLFGEPGGEIVATRLSSACMSAVNLSEVLARFARDGHSPTVVRQRLLKADFEVVPFSTAHAGRSAELAPLTRALGLSLGDRACLALAGERGLPAVTADRVWAKLEIGVTIELIRA